MPIPEPYLALLERLADAFAAYEAATGHSPVLVGGAAVALQTLGAFMSADLDLHAPNDRELAKALRQAGFVAEAGRGRLLGGFYHPEFPEYGVEAISGNLFDGRSDRSRLMRILLHETKSIVIPSAEDMIADRLGQYAASNGRDHDRLAQARLLFRLVEHLDLDYLRRRIKDEGGSVALLDEQPDNRGWSAP